MEVKEAPKYQPDGISPSVGGWIVTDDAGSTFHVYVGGSRYHCMCGGIQDGKTCGHICAAHSFRTKEAN